MRKKPGQVRDAILNVLHGRPEGATVTEIANGVQGIVGNVAASSIRSYLRLNTPEMFARMHRAQYVLKGLDGALDRGATERPQTLKKAAQFLFGNSRLIHDDCFVWLDQQATNSIHAVVTDPPYGLLEYSAIEQGKLRTGRGGVWRIPPSFDGVTRSPLPRFTVLKSTDLDALEEFFLHWGRKIVRVLVPGANVVIASNPLLSYLASGALARAGLERRGEIVRLVRTMRGGDRPKHAHVEFADVSVMPRSMWEPWLVFRKPLDGRVQDNLRKWGTGGFRRISEDKPFGDVIESSPARGLEKTVAPHPSLKPQSFLRHLVRGVLPLGTGVVLDPFAGSGSTIAAAEAVGYACTGIERDKAYFRLASTAIPQLAKVKLKSD